MARNPLLEDEERGPGAPGPSNRPPMGAGETMGSEGAVQQAPGAGRGTGFINPQTILGLNREAGRGLAENVAGGLDLEAQGVRNALQEMQGQAMGPGTGAQYGALQQQAGDIEARGRMAPTFSGVGTLIGQQAGRMGPYSSGMQSWDAFLAGAAGGDRLQRSGMQTQGLGQQVAKAQTAAESAPAPGGGGSADQGGPAKKYDPMSNRFTYGIPMSQRPALKNPLFADMGERDELDPKRQKARY